MEHTNGDSNVDNVIVRLGHGTRSSRLTSRSFGSQSQSPIVFDLSQPLTVVADEDSEKDMFVNKARQHDNNCKFSSTDIDKVTATVKFSKGVEPAPVDMIPTRRDSHKSVADDLYFNESETLQEKNRQKQSQSQKEQRRGLLSLSRFIGIRKPTRKGVSTINVNVIVPKQRYEAHNHNPVRASRTQLARRASVATIERFQNHHGLLKEIAERGNRKTRSITFSTDLDQYRRRSSAARSFKIPNPATLHESASKTHRLLPSADSGLLICMHCEEPQVLERVEHKDSKIGRLNWLVSFGVCMMGGCLGCFLIPFCMQELNDRLYYCNNCDNLMGQVKQLDYGFYRELLSEEKDTIEIEGRKTSEIGSDRDKEGRRDTYAGK